MTKLSFGLILTDSTNILHEKQTRYSLQKIFSCRSLCLSALLCF